MNLPHATAPQLPTSRYVIPDFEERPTPYGYRRQNTPLFEDRIIFLGVQVDDTSADDIMSQLLVLESRDPDRDITMYINSPGGSFHGHDGHLRHHAVHPPRDPDRVPGSGCPQRPCCWPVAPGQAQALPNARVLIHQPAMEGRAAVEPHRDPGQRDHAPRTWLEETMALHTSKSADEINRDIERDEDPHGRITLVRHHRPGAGIS